MSPKFMYSGVNEPQVHVQWSTVCGLNQPQVHVQWSTVMSPKFMYSGVQ